MKKLKQIVFHSPIRYIIALTMGVILVCLFCGINNRWTSVRDYCDAFFIAGMVLIGFSGLDICAYYGTFDIFSYIFVRRDENHKKPTYGDYSQMKTEKRKDKKLYFVPYLLVGLVFLFVSMLLLILI